MSDKVELCFRAKPIESYYKLFKLRTHHDEDNYALVRWLNKARQNYLYHAHEICCCKRSESVYLYS